MSEVPCSDRVGEWFARGGAGSSRQVETSMLCSPAFPLSIYLPRAVQKPSPPSCQAAR